MLNNHLNCLQHTKASFLQIFSYIALYSTLLILKLKLKNLSFKVVIFRVWSYIWTYTFLEKSQVLWVDISKTDKFKNIWRSEFHYRCIESLKIIKVKHFCIYFWVLTPKIKPFQRCNCFYFLGKREASLIVTGERAISKWRKQHY